MSKIDEMLKQMCSDGMELSLVSPNSSKNISAQYKIASIFQNENGIEKILLPVQDMYGIVIPWNINPSNHLIYPITVLLL